jgi:hypothetical protein
MKRIVTAAAAAIILAGAAQAQQPRQTQRPAAQAPRPAAPAATRVPTRVTAGTLAAICGQDRNACLTYVLGATDAFASALVAAGRPQVFCFPANTTNDQIAQSVFRFIQARPGENGSNAGLVVLAALSASFPCGR